MVSKNNHQFYQLGMQLTMQQMDKVLQLIQIGLMFHIALLVQAVPALLR